MKTDTAEEVLDRWVTWDYELDQVADKFFFLKAMEEYASQFKASEPIEKEQEALFDELLSKYMRLIRYESGSGWHAVQELMKDFTITRKQTDNGN